MLAVVLLLVAAAQGPASDDPRSMAAGGAGFLFGQACLLRLNVDQTAAAYAAGSDDLGRGVVADTPALKGVLTIDGADGRGCRLTYAGDQADLAWRSLTAPYAKATQGPSNGCTVLASSADRLAAVCTSTAEAGDPKSATRRADLLFTRSGTGAGASVTALLSHVRL